MDIEHNIRKGFFENVRKIRGFYLYMRIESKLKELNHGIGELMEWEGNGTIDRIRRQALLYTHLEFIEKKGYFIRGLNKTHYLSREVFSFLANQITI